MTQVPNVVGLTLKEAKESLEGFEVDYGELKNDSVIYEQIPEAGVEIQSDGKIYLK